MDRSVQHIAEELGSLETAKPQTLVDIEVSETGRIPDGMIVLELPAGRFLKVSTEWGSYCNNFWPGSWSFENRLFQPNHQ